jgi:serine/threonine protein kinase
VQDQTPGDPFLSEPPPRDSSSNIGKSGMDFIKYGNEQVKVVRILSGGMGEVYICEPLSKDSSYLSPAGNPIYLALKTFQKRLFFHRAAREAFEREVRIWMQLSIMPHILPAFELIYYDNRPFVSMHAVVPPDGTTVRNLLNQGPLPRKQVYSFAFQVAYGLDGARKRIPGVVHGDLKPENLLVELGQWCQISDFGLARVITEANPQAELEGTWAYRAPESWSTSASVSPLSDIYSFGVILYEMLTSKLPFQATTREEWNRSHQEEYPHPLENFPQEGTDAALMALALRCLQKNPADRPQGFEAIWNELFQLAQGDDDLKQAHILISALDQMSGSLDVVLFRTERIAALIKNGDHQLALTQLETMSKASFDGRLWYLYGHALALNSRDEEALAAIEKALRFDITEQLYYNCSSLYALSLKHLGRYQEAINLYKQLLVLVPDEMLGRMVINLATVYIESNRPKEAVDYLEPYLRDHPEDALGWVNLGSAYRWLEHYAEAMKCYQCALAIAPERAEVLVLLGGMLMEHLGRIEDAAVCFQAAWDQGYLSYELLMRYLTCNLLLDRKQLVAQLVAVAQDDFSEDELAKLKVDIWKLQWQIIQSWRAHTQHEEQQVVSGEDRIQAQAGGNEEPTHAGAQQIEPEPPIQDGVSTPDADSPSDEQYFPMPFLIPRVPSLIPRFYVDEGVYSLDFYYDPTAPDYVERFMYCWRKVVRDPSRKPFGSVLTLSVIPFYFTRCPTCELPILTNRRLGKSLGCQRCRKEHTASVTKDSDLDVLVGRILEALGKKRTDLTGQMQLILIQSADEDDHTKLVEDICFRTGFTPLPQAHPAAIHLLYTLAKNGIPNWRPYSLWQKMSDNGQYAYVGETPPEVEHLVRMFRLNGLELNSVSSTYDPADSFFGAGQAQTETEMIEEFLRKAEVAADQYQINTLPLQISLLLWLGKINKAKEKAQAFARQHPDEAGGWILLGKTEMASGHFQAAVEAFEKANVIDPVARAVMFFLVQCYWQLGDTFKAEMWSARWRSLGGSL